MLLPKILFDNGVLETMIISSVEVYPLETLGLIFGTQVSDEFNCIACYPVQLADRETDHVSCDEKTIDRVKRSVGTTHGYGVLGCYHSHPRGTADPSVEDIDALKLLNLPLLVVVSVQVGKPDLMSFEIASNSISLNCLGYNFQIKSHDIRGRARTIDGIVSPFVEVNKLMQSRLGINSFHLARLTGRDRDSVKYSVDKILFDIKRSQDPLKTAYSNENIDHHVNRIRRILGNYSLD